MRYKHRTPKYNCNTNTKNDHIIIWNEIDKIINENGFISRVRMDSLCLKYGKGKNKGNVDYAHYLIHKLKSVVPV